MTEACTNRTHRVGALPQSHHGLCGTRVGPGRTPTVHLCPKMRLWVAQNTLHARHRNDKSRFTTPRFDYQQNSCPIFKPCFDMCLTIFDMTFSLCDVPELFFSIFYRCDNFFNVLISLTSSGPQRRKLGSTCQRRPEKSTS